MLDQNTDRMWYVIGAVIIGAAIIFILNGTMPELFASVGETFESKTKQTTAVVNEIRPDGNTNIIRHDVWKMGILAKGSHYTGDYISNGIFATTNLDDQYIERHIPTYGARSITLELHDTISIPGVNYGRMNAYDKDKQVISTFADFLNKSEPFVEEYVLPEGTAYIRVMLINGESGVYSILLNR